MVNKWGGSECIQNLQQSPEMPSAVGALDCPGTCHDVIPGRGVGGFPVGRTAGPCRTWLGYLTTMELASLHYSSSLTCTFRLAQGFSNRFQQNPPNLLQSSTQQPLVMSKQHTSVLVHLGFSHAASWPLHPSPLHPSSAGSIDVTTSSPRSGRRRTPQT